MTILKKCQNIPSKYIFDTFRTWKYNFKNDTFRHFDHHHLTFCDFRRVTRIIWMKPCYLLFSLIAWLLTKGGRINDEKIWYSEMCIKFKNNSKKQSYLTNKGKFLGHGLGGKVVVFFALGTFGQQQCTIVNLIYEKIKRKTQNFHILCFILYFCFCRKNHSKK